MISVRTMPRPKNLRSSSTANATPRIIARITAMTVIVTERSKRAAEIRVGEDRLVVAQPGEVRAAGLVPEVVLEAVPQRHEERDLRDDHDVDQRGQQRQAALPALASADPPPAARRPAARTETPRLSTDRLIVGALSASGQFGRGVLRCVGLAVLQRLADTALCRRSRPRSAGRPQGRGSRTAGCRRTGRRRTAPGSRSGDPGPSRRSTRA